MTRKALRARLAVLAIALTLAAQPSAAQQISDVEFWRLVTTISEPGGTFAAQLMSNEDSAQFVLPELERSAAAGGAYVGVGSEQNFTYLATLRPRLAFVIDIRRDNLLQMLMYKALFEAAPTRSEFVSTLFSRARPAQPLTSATAKELFAAFEGSTLDATILAETTAAVMDRITRVHAWPITDTERATIERMMQTFGTAGPFGLRGYGDRNPSYAELMAATDLDGREQSYLATEARYQTVRTLQLENRIVPVVGDFAGDRALRAIGRELTARGERLRTFYVSNVERYLWEQGAHGRIFYENVTALPRDPSSVFIRSLTTDISVRQNIPVPVGPARWRTLLFSIEACLNGLATGRIQTYRDLFVPQ